MDHLDEELLALHGQPPTVGVTTDDTDASTDTDGSESDEEPIEIKRGQKLGAEWEIERMEAKSCQGCEGGGLLCEACGGMLEIQLGEGYTHDRCKVCGKRMHGDFAQDCECCSDDEEDTDSGEEEEGNVSG